MPITVGMPPPEEVAEVAGVAEETEVVADVERAGPDTVPTSGAGEPAIEDCLLGGWAIRLLGGEDAT